MIAYRLEPSADRWLDKIYDYTAERWGEAQADRYIVELFDTFRRIAARDIPWRALPASIGIDGYSARCGSHVIYWREDPIEGVEIVSILHERMNQRARLIDDLA